MPEFTNKRLKVDSGSIYTEDGFRIAMMDRSEEATKAGISPVERDANAHRFVFLWNQALDVPSEGVRKVCAKCGTIDVWIDAKAYWNEVRQDWSDTVIMDSLCYCESCEGECTIKDVVIGTRPVVVGMALTDGTWIKVRIDVPGDLIDKFERGVDICAELTKLSIDITGKRVVFATIYSISVEEPEEPDDRAFCVGCARPISDEEHIDNEGFCNECCDIIEGEIEE